MEPFIGQVMMFGGNFAPRGWALCQGQLLAISSHSALFSILGTIYGGDGRTTFALPDLRGRTAIQQGNGPGLTSRRLGQKAGTQTNTMTVATMPSHNHGVMMPVNTGAAGESTGFLAATDIYAEEETSGAKYPGTSSMNSGSQTPYNNIQPLLTVNYIIALVGIYPSRS